MIEFNDYKTPKYIKHSGFHNGIARVAKQVPSILNQMQEEINAKFNYLNRDNYIDKSGKELFTENFLQATDFNEYGLALVRDSKTGAWGILDKDLKMRIPFKYQKIDFCGSYLAVQDNDLWGIVNLNGEVIVPCEYSRIKTYVNNLCIVFKDGKVGVIDKQGNLILPIIYNDIYIQDGAIVALTIGSVNHQKRFYLFDEQGKLIKPFDSLIVFKDKRAIVSKKSGKRVKYGYIDTLGEEVIPCKYEYCEPFNNGKAIAKKKKGFKMYYGVIDTEGREVIPFKYTDIEHKNLYTILSNKNEKIYLDYNNNRCDDRVIAFEGSDIVLDHDFVNGLARVEQYGYYGFVNTSLELVVPCELYNSSVAFQDGLIAVSDGELWGFIDGFGNEVIPCQYKYVSDFSEGLAWVKTKEGEEFYIDKENKRVIDLNTLNSTLEFGNTSVVVSAENKIELIRKKRELVKSLIPVLNSFLSKDVSELQLDLEADECDLTLRKEKKND